MAQMYDIYPSINLFNSIQFNSKRCYWYGKQMFTLQKQM